MLKKKMKKKKSIAHVLALYFNNKFNFFSLYYNEE